MSLRAFLTVGTVSALDRVLLPNKYADLGGRCMDGTMAGYYYAAPSTASDIWVIDMDGGGACHSKATCEKWAKKGSGKGSSENWLKTKSPSKRQNILSDDADINPDFHGAHKVNIPYCTGDTHVGTIVEPTSAQWGYYFSGHLNFEFIVQHIFYSVPEFRQASRVLFTGSSAGGIGNIHNCDFLQDTLDSLGVAAKVSCAPRAGWYVPGFTDDQDDSELPPSSWAKWSIGQTGGPDQAVSVQQRYVHPDCAKAHSSQDASKCQSASVVYPYIKAPMYVIENNYDYSQLFAGFGLPKKSLSNPHEQEYVAYFGRAMRNSTRQILAKSGDGLFLASCFEHTDGIDFPGDTKLKGFSSGQGLGDWFFGRKTVPAFLVDDCGDLPCNPTCPTSAGGVVV